MIPRRLDSAPCGPVTGHPATGRRLRVAVAPRALAALLLTFVGPACDTIERFVPRGEAESEPGAVGEGQGAPGAGTTPIVGTSDKVYALGEQGHASDFTMSIDDIKDCAVEPHFQPRAGYRKLGIRVVLQGTSPQEVPVNPFYALLRTPGGSEFRSTLSGCRPPLPAVRLTKGKRAEGWITFDAPTKEPRFVLSYNPTIIGRGSEELRFSVTP